jgi:hypothetical protein
MIDLADEPTLPEDANADSSEAKRRRVIWWPEKWAVATGPNMGGTPMVGYRHAWWQCRKRRRMSDVRNLESFDWRTVRINFRRSPDHRHNDPPTR